MSTANLSTKSKKSSSTADSRTVTGRFAPSPTGPLHLGSLLAATASYLDAHARNGRWTVRIDDLDQPRNVSGAEDQILQALEAHGLLWDGEIVHQSDHREQYQAALSQLRARIFYCTCSRKDLQGQAVYPGTCRQYRRPRPGSAVRIEIDSEPVVFTDLIMGEQRENLAESVGDFIIRRRDGLIAYQLATAVDDGGSNVSHVVRGSDLLDNTARQIYLMQALGLDIPQYAHVPTLLSPSGQKLSKQHHAPAIVNNQAARNLTQVMSQLGMQLPPDAAAWPPAEVLRWGVSHWQLAEVPNTNLIIQL